MHSRVAQLSQQQASQLAQQLAVGHSTIAQLSLLCILLDPQSAD